MVLSMFGGEWNTGFIIQDENENQFVWIPVSNKDIIGTQKLLKKDFKIGPIISKETCLDDNYEAFIESALENGGFYISRYEIGIKDGKVVSKNNIKLEQEFNKTQIIEKINRNV